MFRNYSAVTILGTTKKLHAIPAFLVKESWSLDNVGAQNTRDL